ncbi:hypothetical protein BX666DRAFT_1936891 [Dichotomocladium elegans]|nr:hypothetical protein BX666DRAFT_1936891 [Dichotomocladium elegans]
MDDQELAHQLQQQLDREDEVFAIEPITNCPHVPAQLPTQVFLSSSCRACNEPQENWQCLTCNAVLCSRYRNAHMLAHFNENKSHAVCLSYSDLSLWCFACENYINNSSLQDLKYTAYIAKFGEDPPAITMRIMNDAGSSSKQ